MTQQNQNSAQRSPRRFSLVMGATALAWAAIGSGCNKHKEGDGHDHGKAPKAESKGDAHGHKDEEAHTEEVRLTEDAMARYGIKVEEAQLWRLRPLLSVPARLAFNTEAMAHVGSPLRGRVIEVKVRLGEQVSAGQELAIVESPELGEAQGDYFQKRTAQQTAGPTVELAKVTWERAKALLERSQGISLTEVQRREVEHRAAVAQLRAAEAAVLGAQNRLKILGMSDESIAALSASGVVAPRYTIHAAVSGQVIEREVTLGELVGPDREYLMILADTKRLWVLADVPEARLRQVASGAQAWIKTGGDDPLKIEGKVSFVSPSVDFATRTAQVRIEVDAAKHQLKPGMFVQVDIAATDPSGVEPVPSVAVPDDAIQTLEGKPAVFVPVPKEPNTFAKRVVIIGAPVAGLVPILSGLVEGESFVSAGSFILKAELGKAGAEHSH